MLETKNLHNVLNKQRWLIVNKQLLAKMLSEYMYEEMIQPRALHEEDGNIEFKLSVSKDKDYRYFAKKRLFDSFDVTWESIEVWEENECREPKSAIEFLLDIKPLIGMASETAGHLIKELNHTLLADAHLLGRDLKSSDELIYEDYALLEGHMTGHPWITYNKGRIGFGYDDYLEFAPEHQKEVQLLWIAVHKNKASFQSIMELNFETLLAEELDVKEKKQFEKILEDHDAVPSDYYFMPLHEWQWKNIIVQLFAEELANGEIVPLGKGVDAYLPQQSIRTFVNRTNKDKHHVKLPISILNTLVHRGLPAERTLIAPKITEFIKSIYKNDTFLKDECRVILPGEIASINVGHSYYEQLENAPYQYLEMLGVIWRESIYTYLEEEEQAITLAALLYVDKNGKPYVKSLIEQSGLSTEEWFENFFRVVMDPLLHYLYQYGTVFSPHGQNTILVLKEQQPHRLAIKDFVDDVNISDQPFPELGGLPDELKTVLRSEPPEGLTQFIFTGLFICHLRYLANVLENHALLPELTFWEKLADSIIEYQERFPHLKERFDLFDLFKPSFKKLCLNRNRMVDYGYGNDENRPHASEFGEVSNALALFQQKSSTISSPRK